MTVDITLFLSDLAVIESSGIIHLTWPDRRIAADLDLYIRKHPKRRRMMELGLSRQSGYLGDSWMGRRW